MSKRARVLASLVLVAGAAILFTGCPPVVLQTPEPPLGDDGTLMVLAVVDDGRVVGYRYAVRRPDSIGVTTRDLTAQVQEPDFPRKALQLLMQVRVLDAGDAERSDQYIKDPLSPYIEVPADEGGKNMFWTRVGRPITSFLVAVPYFKDARRIEFTRFTPEGKALDAGSIDLADEPLGDSKMSRRAVTNYDPDDAEHDTVIDNGPPEGRLDLLILADGFQDTNADRMLFNQKVHELLAHLWSVPIGYEIRSSINVHTAYLPSTDSGADHLTEGIDLDTPFETYFDCEGLDRLICLTGDGAALAFEVAAGAPGNYGVGTPDSIIILVNDPEYGGGGNTIVISSINVQSPAVFAHEFGHSVMDLADEYEDQHTEAWVEYARTKVNCSGPVEDRNDLKWIDLVQSTTPIPTEADDGSCVRDNTCIPSTLPAGTVGMYEGCGYVACGSFRPTTECQMRCTDAGFFCPVCRGGFHHVLEPFPGPNVDVYMRDNRLDVGNAPSPTNVEDPPGSGKRVKPYQSLDIRVDAPPLGDTEHENPVAGVTNNVYVTVHNRGTDAAGVATSVELHIAEATGGAPPFPGASWTSLGTKSDTVLGNEGSKTLMFEWIAPADVPLHTCALALADAPGDPSPTLGAGLTDLVRNNNNVTWKNLHVLRLGLIEGIITYYEQELRPIVFRIEAPDVPLGTGLELRHDGTLAFTEFEPDDARQMDLSDRTSTLVQFKRSTEDQQWLALRTDLPAGSDKDPFEAEFSLRLTPPGGTPVGTVFEVSIDQIELDDETGLLGDLLGGNDYAVTLE